MNSSRKNVDSSNSILVTIRSDRIRSGLNRINPMARNPLAIVYSKNIAVLAW
jgi:hypothetical protein